MINFLPPEEKENILLDGKKRMLAILGFLFSFFLLCLALALFFIKIHLYYQLELLDLSLAEKEKLAGESEIQSLREKINYINETSVELGAFYQQRISFLEILERVIAVLPPGMSLNNFSAVVSGENNCCAKISMSGFSPSRELLLDLKKNFDKEGKFFKNPYFPQSNWVKSTDINFSATFEI